jgi:glutathione S-transferase
MDASRIDSFLDATLVFGREAQVYLLGMDAMSHELHQRMSGAFDFFAQGVENALMNHDFIASDELTIADIAFVCDVSQFLRERLMSSALEAQSLPMVSEGAVQAFPRTFAHLLALIEKPLFQKYLGEYTKHLKA